MWRWCGSSVAVAAVAARPRPRCLAMGRWEEISGADAVASAAGGSLGHMRELWRDLAQMRVSVKVSLARA
eukprot:15093013-Alexandrium_andersonii.AAC.1